MFDDKRSKKVLLVAHCILNQNAKIDRCAHYPGIVKEVTEFLIDAGIGLVQMPCPELLFLGLDRQADRAIPATIETEDTRVAARMVESQALCRRLAGDLVFQVEEYRKNGFQIVGVVGINGSPTCGVETNWSDGEEAQGPGVFIRVLKEELDRHGIDLPMRGIKVYEALRSMTAIMELCKDTL